MTIDQLLTVTDSLPLFAVTLLKSFSTLGSTSTKGRILKRQVMNKRNRLVKMYRKQLKFFKKIIKYMPYRLTCLK